MKRIISVLLCMLLLFSAVSFSALGAKEEEKVEETSELVLEIDVNRRYTNFANDESDVYGEGANKKELNSEQKTVYIAVLCAALVVSVVVLAVSLKRVPKEEDIDISGQNKIKKSNKDKE